MFWSMTLMQRPVRPMKRTSRSSQSAAMSRNSKKFLIVTYSSVASLAKDSPWPTPIGLKRIRATNSIWRF